MVVTNIVPNNNNNNAVGVTDPGIAPQIPQLPPPVTPVQSHIPVTVWNPEQGTNDQAASIASQEPTMFVPIPPSIMTQRNAVDMDDGYRVITLVEDDESDEYASKKKPRKSSTKRKLLMQDDTMSNYLPPRKACLDRQKKPRAVASNVSEDQAECIEQDQTTTPVQPAVAPPIDPGSAVVNGDTSNSQVMFCDSMNNFFDSPSSNHSGLSQFCGSSNAHLGDTTDATLLSAFAGFQPDQRNATEPAFVETFLNAIESLEFQSNI